VGEWGVCQFRGFLYTHTTSQLRIQCFKTRQLHPILTVPGINVMRSIYS